MLQYRAEFDAAVTFLNGGGLQAQAFRVDVPHGDVTEAEIAALFVAACGAADGRPRRAQRDPRSSPSRTRAPAVARRLPPPARHATAPTTFVELSHVISAGMITYPGLPGPEISDILSRADSRANYAEGTEFAIGRITMVGNTGTYLDSPFHRYGDGTDLAGLPLERLADLPAVVVRTVGSGVRACRRGRARGARRGRPRGPAAHRRRPALGHPGVRAWTRPS